MISVTATRAGVERVDLLAYSRIILLKKYVLASVYQTNCRALFLVLLACCDVLRRRGDVAIYNKVAFKYKYF
jgi:ribosomal protein L36